MDLNNVTLSDAVKCGLAFGVWQGIGAVICRFLRAAFVRKNTVNHSER